MRMNHDPRHTSTDSFPEEAKRPLTEMELMSFIQSIMKNIRSLQQWSTGQATMYEIENKKHELESKRLTLMKLHYMLHALRHGKPPEQTVLPVKPPRLKKLSAKQQRELLKQQREAKKRAQEEDALQEEFGFLMDKTKV